MSYLFGGVEADQLNVKATALFVLYHLVDIDTVAFCVKGQLLLACLGFTFSIRMDGQVVVVGLPNQAVELQNLTLNENLLVSHGVDVVWCQVENFNRELHCLLHAVVVKNT